MMLTNENYFSKEMSLKYMGVSQYKSFMKCQAMAMAEINGDFVRERTAALLVGSYVDAHFEGTLDIFRAQNSEIFKRDGGLKSEYIKAEEIIARIERDPMFMKFMSGEKQVIMTGEINGVLFKIKIDAYHPYEMIVDGKVMRDFEGGYKPEQGRLNWIEFWGYDIQGAVYQEIVKQNIGAQLPFYLAAATKEKETDLGIFQIPQNYLDLELDKVGQNAPMFDAIKKGIIEPERCEHCDYCKRTKVLSKIINMEELDYE